MNDYEKKREKELKKQIYLYGEAVNALKKQIKLCRNELIGLGNSKKSKLKVKK